MGATVLVVSLAGLVLPISLILAAVLLDFVVVAWALYRMWHDHWAHRVWEFFTLRFLHPVARTAGVRGPVTRPH